MIRNIAVYCISSILFLACDAVDENRVIPHPRAHAYLKSEIQGDWQLVDKIFVPEKQSMEKYNEAVEKGWNDEYDPVADVVEGTIIAIREFDMLETEGKFLHIVKDSIIRLNYPFEIKKERRFRLRSNVITAVKEERMHLDFIRNNVMKISYLTFYGLYVEETYKRVSFDDKEMQILKKHRLNYPMLEGTWALMRDDNYYGFEYILDSSFILPDELILKRDQLEKMMETDFGVYFLTNGVKRKYFLSYDLERRKITLIPDKWFDQEAWKKEHYSPFALYFLRMNKE